MREKGCGPVQVGRTRLGTIERLEERLQLHDLISIIEYSLLHDLILVEVRVVLLVELIWEVLSNSCLLIQGVELET